MQFSKINPFVRYARYINLRKDSDYSEAVALDARLFYTRCGYGKIKAADVLYDMPPHALLLVQAGIPYHIQAPDEAVEYIALNFDYTQNAAQHALPVKPEAPQDFSPDMRLDPCRLEDAACLDGVLYLPQIGTVEKKLTAIVSEYTQKLLYHSEKCGHLLAACIADALRLSQIGHLSSEGEQSNKIISHIQQHFRSDITNSSVGKAFGYHPNYVSALVRHMTGMPLHRYVLHLRLMHAARLLENTGLSVGEVALACGFCDVAYFSAYFKKHFGTPPSQYRMG